MKICETPAHNEIVYEEDRKCPLCAALDQIDDLKSDLARAKEDIAQLRSDLKVGS